MWTPVAVVYAICILLVDSTASEAENNGCDVECSEHGCRGPGPGMCLHCKNKRLEASNKCVANCSDEMQYDVPGNMCRSCDEQCAVGCYGPNATQCTACKYVKFLGLNNTSECMSECPAPLLTAPYYYPDENNICRQCDPSCDEGCSGNQTHVGFGGCMTCVLAINRTQENDTVRCLPMDRDLCPAGYFSTQYRSVVPNYPLNKKQVCQPCDPLCLTCTTEGVANCPQCRYYRSGNQGSSTCVKDCPIYHFKNNVTRTCDKCHDLCLDGCHGPTSIDCDNCNKFKIIISEENNSFECVTECPAEFPELVEDTVHDRPTMTVCAGRDHPTVLTRLSKIKEGEQAHQDSLGNRARSCVLGLVVFVLVGYYSQKRKEARENAILGGLPKSEPLKPLKPSDAKPDLSKLNLIKESELRRGEIIGSGAFGTVYKGFYVPMGNIRGFDEIVKVDVAIKVLQEGTLPYQELLEEARVMASVDHPCCIRILAVCMASQMMLITQRMPLGCLLEYIKKHKENTGSKALLNWCTQIARGMGYLEERGIVHRDLAARNVLVQSAELVKITDFGHAKHLDYDEDHFQSSGEKLPFRWLALECINNRIFTHKSDVWSFGVTVWELFTYGCRPYESVEARDVPKLIEKGERLPQPPICTINVYMLMIKCWMLNAESRPFFSELVEEFAKMARDPGRYLVIQGDALMRLPSISDDKEDELARLLDVAGDEYKVVVGSDEYLKTAPVVDSDEYFRTAPVVGSDEYLKTAPVVGSDEYLKTAPVVGSDKYLKTAPVVGSDEYLKTAPVVGSDEYLKTSPVVGSDEYLKTAPVVGSDEYLKTAPVVGSDEYLKTAPVVGSDEYLKTAPVVGSDEYLKTAPVMGSDEYLKTAPVVGSDKYLKTAPVVGSDEYLKTAPVVGSDEYLKTSPVVGSDEYLKTAPVVGSDEYLKTAPVVGSDEYLKTAPVVGSDEYLKTAPVVGSDEYLKTAPVVGSDDYLKTAPVVGSDEYLKTAPVVGSDEYLKTAPVVGFDEYLKTATVVGSDEYLKTAPVVGFDEYLKTATVVGSDEYLKTAPVVSSDENLKTAPVVGSDEYLKTAPVVGSDEYLKTAPPPPL